MGGELEFPEAIIQSIQSLLTEKEAARTTILSKSWHRAWLTRPYLELDSRDFKESRDFFTISEFSKYAKKTIKRYEQSNLKIQRFTLYMTINCYASAELANKLIVKAVRKLGATHISLRLYGDGGRIVLPREVLFVADNLVGLSVGGCEIKLDGIEIKCSKLKSLHLQGVGTTSDALCNIISRCPLIEYLSLSWIDFDYQNNKPFWWPGTVLAKTVSPRPVVPMNTNLDRLRCLVLCYESFKTLFPGDELSKFPFLTDLTLNLNPWDKEGNAEISERDVQISNCSLEHIKIVLEKEKGWRRRKVLLKVRLDVPSIRKFTFEGGDVIPELSLVSTCTREWESHVSIARIGHLSAFWFGELNKFLTQLRQSKIHLSLRVQSTESFDFMVGDVESIIRKHELENLMIDIENLPSFSCYALFDGLFRLCRPKLITHQILKKVEEEEEVPQRKTNIGLLCQVLDQGIHLKVSDPGQFMYGLNDLEEANAQIFDDSAMGWRPPIPLKLLESRDRQQRVRLLLKWKTF